MHGRHSDSQQSRTWPSSQELSHDFESYQRRELHIEVPPYFFWWNAGKFCVFFVGIKQKSKWLALLRLVNHSK